MHALQPGSTDESLLAAAPGVTDLAPEHNGTGLAARRCVSPRCRRDGTTGALTPRLAAARSMLCGHCRDRLDQQLRNLPDWYANLERAAGLRRPRTPGVPMSGQVVELRAVVRGILAAWSHAVVDERQVARPVRTIAGMAEFLRRNLEWLASHPAVAEFANGIGEAADAAAAVTDAASRAVASSPA